MPKAQQKQTPEGKASVTTTEEPAKKTLRVPKAKQVDLPGMENRNIPEIEEAAETYRDARDERIACSKTESDRKQRLIEIMQKHNRTLYAYKGLLVDLTKKLDVKVRTERSKDDEDEE